MMLHGGLSRTCIWSESGWSDKRQQDADEAVGCSDGTSGQASRHVRSAVSSYFQFRPNSPRDGELRYRRSQLAYGASKRASEQALSHCWAANERTEGRTNDRWKSGARHRPFPAPPCPARPGRARASCSRVGDSRLGCCKQCSSAGGPNDRPSVHRIASPRQPTEWPSARPVGRPTDATRLTDCRLGVRARAMYGSAQRRSIR